MDDLEFDNLVERTPVIHKEDLLEYLKVSKQGVWTGDEWNYLFKILQRNIFYNKYE